MLTAVYCRPCKLWCTLAEWKREHRMHQQAGRITEKTFQRQIMELARWLGYFAYHPWNSQHSEAGFPDTVLVKPNRLIIAELKVGKNKLTAAQQRWMTALGTVPGIETYVWYPKDWDEIVEILRRK